MMSRTTRHSRLASSGRIDRFAIYGLFRLMQTPGEQLRRGLGHGRDVARIAGSSRSDAGELAMNDPFRIFDNLREAYLRYLDSPFRLRYRALMEERRQLLDQDRQLYRRPLFEPVVPYEVSTSAIHAAARQVGASTDVADYVASSGLFPAKRTLFQHQLDAWAASKTEIRSSSRPEPGRGKPSATCFRCSHIS